LTSLDVAPRAPAPTISVVVPNHNGWRWIPGTVDSILSTRQRRDGLEIVVVDDASTERVPLEQLRAVVDRHTDQGVQVRVVRSPQRLGVAGARNQGCASARGEIIVMTDAHVHFEPGWDGVVIDRIAPATILAGTVRDPTSGFRGFGCTLVVPFMGTYWVRQPVAPGTPTQIASSAATVFLRETFERVGGYDAGMIIYGAAEPEFSLRAWLSGVRIEACPDHVVRHRFKTADQRRTWIQEVRTYHVHNNMRFGLLYLERAMALEMIRHLCQKFPSHAPRALSLLAAGDLDRRRGVLESRLTHDLAWFADRFQLVDQIGEPLYEGADRRN
jgi:glycosyltransferase involved in cell wall biosynthesis